MNDTESPYPGNRFPREIASHAVWLYYRFGLSLRDVEDLLAERGVRVSYETIRQWTRKFGLDYARWLRRKQGRLGDYWFLDEVFVRIQGRQQYLSLLSKINLWPYYSHGALSPLIWPKLTTISVSTDSAGPLSGGSMP